MTLASGNEKRKRLPPYISYKTYRSFLDGLQQDGIPERIDRDYWKDRLSGSSGTQLMTALRFLVLIDADSVPTARLKSLLYARGSQKADLLKQIIAEAYGFLSGAVNPQAGSYAQMEAAFHRTFQLAGDVSRKCIKFYIAIAGEAGLVLSSSITNRVRSTRNGTSTGIIPRKKNAKIVPVPLVERKVELLPDSMLEDKLLITKFPSFDPTWKEEVQISWFKAYGVTRLPPFDPGWKEEIQASWFKALWELLRIKPEQNVQPGS